MKKLVFTLIVLGLIAAPAHFAWAAGKGKGKSGKVPPGLEKQGGVPPGQAKKTGDASTNAADTTPKPPKSEPPKSPESPKPAPAPNPTAPEPAKPPPSPTPGGPFKPPVRQPRAEVTRPGTPPIQRGPVPPTASATNKAPATVKVPEAGQTNQVSNARTNRFRWPFGTKRR